MSYCRPTGGDNATNPAIEYSPSGTEHDRTLLGILYTFNDPNQDLVGLGAMIGFLAAGILTQFFSLLLHRLKDCKSYTLGRKGEVTRTHITYRIVKRLSPAAVDDPLQFWINLISAFLIGLSDQQLVMGFLVLSIMVGTQGASFSMWMAQFISFFTLITHAATFSSLRPYFRRYRWLTLIRVMVMVTVYALFIIVNTSIFEIIREVMAMPLVKEKDSGGSLKGYYRQFTVIFGLNIGVMTWIYLSMIPSMFISDGLVKVRKVIARWPLQKEDVDSSVISDWLQERTMGSHTTGTKWRTRQGFTIGGILLKPYELFCRLFLRTKSKPVRGLLWLVAEIFFPWALVPAVLFLHFCALLGYLCYLESGYASQTVWNYGQILTIAMVALPVWALVQGYYQDKTAAEEEKRESVAKTEHVNIESKAWADKLGIPQSLDTGDRDIPEPEYRPRSRQYED